MKYGKKCIHQWARLFFELYNYVSRIPGQGVLQDQHITCKCGPFSWLLQSKRAVSVVSGHRFKIIPEMYRKNVETLTCGIPGQSMPELK